MIQILYQDSDIIVCLKPTGVISQEGGNNSMPEILRKQLNVTYVGVVHRLDKEVGGIMVFALHPAAAASLSRSVQEHALEKRYFAVVCGNPENDTGLLEDLLYHDKSRNKTYVVTRKRSGVKPARLEYRVEEQAEDNCLVDVLLHTGRTHQIRVQFASRQLPLYGDRKYGGCAGSFGLWSYQLAFPHPVTGERLMFSQLPPDEKPWSSFAGWNILHR